MKSKILLFICLLMCLVISYSAFGQAKEEEISLRIMVKTQGENVYNYKEIRYNHITGTFYVEETLNMEDRFKLFAEFKKDRYLVILNINPENEINKLYPINGSLKVESDKKYTFPEEFDKAFSFASNSGREMLVFILSDYELPIFNINGELSLENSASLMKLKSSRDIGYFDIKGMKSDCICSKSI